MATEIDVDSIASDRPIATRAKIYRLTARQCQQWLAPGYSETAHHIELLRWNLGPKGDKKSTS